MNESTKKDRQYILVEKFDEYDLTVRIPFFPEKTFDKEHMGDGLEGIREIVERFAHAVAMLFIIAKACMTEEHIAEVHSRFRATNRWIDESLTRSNIFMEDRMRDAFKLAPADKKEEILKGIVELIEDGKISPSKRQRLQKMVVEMSKEV